MSLPRRYDKTNVLICLAILERSRKERVYAIILLCDSTPPPYKTPFNWGFIPYGYTIRIAYKQLYNPLKRKLGSSLPNASVNLNKLALPWMQFKRIIHA